MKSHGISKRSLHIDLVEASPRLMPRMSQRYSRKIAKRLRRLGIKLYLSQQVQAETADRLMVSGHSIESHTVVWTAGITNHPFFKNNSFALSDHGKVVVDQYLQAEENIYVIGDNADTTYSGMAQTALFDAVFVAKNLRRLVHGQNRHFYKPKRPVYVTPAGPHWAAVSWGPLEFFGWLGWLVRIAADFVGYKDFESWRRATQHLVSELEDNDDCRICTGK
jgi:NADH dehydrogenase